MHDVAIIAARRTAIGGFMAGLSGLRAPELAQHAIRAAVADANLGDIAIDGASIGLVLSAGVGQAPARQAVLGAGLPLSVPARTVSKVCGSGLQAILDEALRIRAGDARVAIAGGMESMSNAPHFIPGSRGGKRLGHGQMLDHMFHDGLEDAYDKGTLMGRFAEDCARSYAFSREEQDAFAIRSLERALAAAEGGAFDAEIAPVTIKGRNGDVLIDRDEQPGLARPDKIPHLRPAFRADGTVTAASSSSISDGAAALVLASRQMVADRGLVPRAWIAGAASHAQEPALFTTAPVASTRKLLDRLGWTTSDVDLWEVNEAFAVVAMAFTRDLGLSPEVVNVHGGACALGHPIGASGARIVVTLLNAMEQRDLRRGIASICIGGGEALSIALERA